MIQRKINFTRREEKRYEHINNVKNQLEMLNDQSPLKKSKSKGFMNIYFFTIVLGIIFILSIIYIIIS